MEIRETYFRLLASHGIDVHNSHGLKNTSLHNMLQVIRKYNDTGELDVKAEDTVYVPWKKEM